MKNNLAKLTMMIAALGGFLAIVFSASGLIMAIPTPVPTTPPAGVGGSANPNYDSVCKGIEATGGDCNSGEDEINKLVAAIINVFSWVVGVVAVLMVIYGGFEFVTSGGDSAKSAKGRNTIFYALIGLVIVALAQVLVKFVLNKATDK
ncbi:MAG: hypothetical protein WCP03_01910 [Candidatus Saccharibacteria bacterium]